MMNKIIILVGKEKKFLGGRNCEEKNFKGPERSSNPSKFTHFRDVFEEKGE